MHIVTYTVITTVYAHIHIYVYLTSSTDWFFAGAGDKKRHSYHNMLCVCCSCQAPWAKVGTSEHYVYVTMCIVHAYVCLYACVTMRCIQKTYYVQICTHTRIHAYYICICGVSCTHTVTVQVITYVVY